MRHRSAIFVVISIIVVALVYSQPNTSDVFAAPPHPNFISSTDCDTGPVHYDILRCCWTEIDPSDPEGIELHYCQTCDGAGNCTDVYPDPRTTKQPLSSLTPDVTEEVAPPSPPGPKVPRGNMLPDGGVLQELEQTPESLPSLQQPGEIGPEVAPPTAEDGTGQPPTETLCIESFELDKDTNLCVPTESQATEQPQEAAEESEEQQQTEEQPSEESDTGEDSNN